MGEKGEGNPSGEDEVFEDKDEDVPDDGSCERDGENKWEDFEEVCWKEEKELGGNDDTDGSPYMVSYDACAPLEGRAVLLSLDRQHGIEQCRTDAVENSRKNEEDAPEECKALAENAREEEWNDKRSGIAEQCTERSAALSDEKDTCLAPDMESNSHKEDDENEGEEFSLEKEVLDDVPYCQRGEEEEESDPPQEALLSVGVPRGGKGGEKRHHGLFRARNANESRDLECCESLLLFF